jgi:two-component system nitrate/nitrite response regulator NarL
MSRTTVVIADRHPIVLQGINIVLAAQHDFAVVASCGSGADCLEAIRRLVPDIVLLDVAMPDMNGAEILAFAKSAGLRTRVVFFAGLAEDPKSARLAAYGAHAVVPKDATPAMLVEILRQVAQGQRSQSVPRTSQGELPATEEEKPLTQLTERERQIMRLVSEGLSNKEIGRRLNIAEGTIKVHLHRIFQKLDISNRTILAAMALS